MNTKVQAEITQEEVLDTLQGALRKGTHLRLTAEETKVLSLTDVSKKLINEDLTLIDDSLHDLEFYKSNLMSKIKQSVENGTGLRLSSMELDLIMETPLASALGISGMTRKKTVAEHLTKSVNRLTKCINLGHGIRFSKLELTMLSKTKAFQEFITEYKGGWKEQLESEDKTPEKPSIPPNKKGSLETTLEEPVATPEEEPVAIPEEEPVVTPKEKPVATPEEAVTKKQEQVAAEEAQPVETEDTQEAQPVETEDTQEAQPVVKTTTPEVKREYCIAREVSIAESVGLSDLEFLVDRSKSNTLFWTKNNYNIIKVFLDFNEAKEFANSKDYGSLRVIPKKQAVRKIKEQIEIISYERSLKDTPVGVGDGLTLNII